MESNMLERRAEISSKLFQMGTSLCKESRETGDFCVNKAGAFLIFIAGIMLDEKDVEEYGIISSMYAAKKIMDDLEEKNIKISDILKDFNDLDDDEENLNNN
jgi:hypothetical protein